MAIHWEPWWRLNIGRQDEGRTLGNTMTDKGLETKWWLKNQKTQRWWNIGKHKDDQTSGNTIMAIALVLSPVHPISESRGVLQTNRPTTNFVCNIRLLQKTWDMALGITEAAILTPLNDQQWPESGVFPRNSLVHSTNFFSPNWAPQFRQCPYSSFFLYRSANLTKL